MSRLRIRIYLLIVLLIANGVLVGMWLSGRQNERNIERQERADMAAVLSRKGVTLSQNFVWPDSAAYTLYYENDAQQLLDIARLLCGDCTVQENDDGSKIYTGPTGTVAVTANGRWSGMTQLGSWPSASATSAFRDVAETSGQRIRQSFDGRKVINGGLTLTAKEGGNALSGCWIAGNPKAVRDTLSRSAKACLLTYLSVPDHIKFSALQQAELVYVCQSDEPLLKPAWQLTTDEGAIYLDAVTGYEILFT